VTTTQQQGERLKTLLSLIHLSQTALAQRLGYTRGYVSLLINGEKPISQQVLNLILEMFPKVNIHWLLSGMGEPMLGRDVGEMYQIEADRPRTLDDLEAEYKADPLAGLRELIARVEELEKWKAEWEARLSMSPTKDE
jgi:transcriptional regulator with XRE-family HTH domain